MEIFSDPTVLYGSLFIIAMLVLIGLRWFTKRTGIPTDDIQEIAKEVKDTSEEKLKESFLKKVEKKTKPPSIGLILIILFTGLMIQACNLIKPATQLLSDNIEITWKTDKAIDKVPIDSIVVRFTPVYWKELPDTNHIEKEKEFIRSGYTVWRLKTPTMTRYEVQKKDTVIYIYKKK